MSNLTIVHVFRLKNMLLVGMILFLVNFLILKMMYCFMINLVKPFYSKVHVADRYHLYSIVSRGKPKKGGRIALREGKRLRPSIEQDLDDEEDLDIV
ncbi:hypothetical protein BHM03_00002944 [Ensete ventricosum]|uniref:Uncharacterized protein n=1 Tax=Ensete ventricosum TaxID=4639 RepID=A0A445M9V5_ENSVE|nr:hypothetical protein BHM03_00002944 [Ensete ventricosum]